MLIDKILNCLHSIGIYADQQDLDAPLESLIQDSITYVSFIVELEHVLEIQIPDEFFIDNSFENLNAMVRAISLLLEQEMV